ncbi:MAG: T9SS type A sorting domain-containing protein [Flavobacteriales bacterium]|nr:T9SS type A sorting domain-containing protein [Flavobacteriales bacterium]
MNLRRSLLGGSLALSLLASAQDTLHVQTLSFDSITTRRGWFQFPDTSHHYRKVLMHHTLKCDAATTQDQYDCGEWDYLTYNFIHEHTGLLDSAALQHPWFKVGASTPTSIETIDVPSYDLWTEPAPKRTILSVITESDHAVGTADAIDASSLNVDRGAARSQYLFLAAELTAAGLQPGLPIERLRFPVLVGGEVGRLTVRMKQTLTSSISTFEELGLTTVFHQSGEAFATAGTATLDLVSPFTWDGTSNLLVEIATEKETATVGPQLSATSIAPGQGVQEVGRDGQVRVNDDFIGLDPAPLTTLSTEVTILFRAKGDASLPVNTSVFEARNAQNQRVLNIHLPWSNGSVYWDAGNVGGSYDRINKAATTTETEEQWNEWAFTKNTVTGSMKIYLNGILWHSGSGMTRPMTGIVGANFGAAGDRSVPYRGDLDDLVIFSTELDAATIASWTGHRIDASHPAWANAIYAFGFNETVDVPHMALNAADAAHPAWLMGTVQHIYTPATSLSHAAQSVLGRPDITFTQGTYTDVVDPLELLRPTPRTGVAREVFEVNGNSVLAIDTVFSFLTGQAYTYDANNVATDSLLITGITYMNDTLNYFGVPFEVVNNWEVGRYITPYGIGLSLGANGFRWTYDVTDYQHLLHDSVEVSGGNQQELLDLDFELIEGASPRPVVNLQRPWGPMASRSYGSLSDDTQMAAVTVAIDPQATQWAMRSRLTGHGHNSNDGNYPHCCEWKDNTHYLYANGTQVDDWHIWQENDCALNPVYPQGGTWLGSREGWCPGDLVKDHMTELTPFVSGNTLTVDYGITPVPTNNAGMAGGNYVMNMDLFEFGAATHALDAEVYQVKRPTDEGYRKRNNPICIDPLVVLRNAGSQDLTSVTFAYGVSGGTVKYHTWTGLLKHMQSAEVTLPVTDGTFWMGDTQQNFTVTVSGPNGGVDQNADNDTYTTHFALPAVYTENFIVYLKTNNRASENSITIRDQVGTVVYSRSGMSNNTIYQDTLSLWDGCYTMELLDTGNDGLSYWADTQAGTGQFRFKRLNNSTLKSFQAEFGRSIHWAFTLGGFVGVQEKEQAFTVSAFPNPTNGQVRVHITDMDGPALLEVVDQQGRRVQTRSVELTGETDVNIDLSVEAQGLYLVRLFSEGRTAAVRLLRQ